MTWFQLPVVVMLVIRENDRVLLARRCNTGFKDGYYALPGGKHDGHETLTQSAAREAQEELGIVCETSSIEFRSAIHVRGSYSPSELVYFCFEIMQYQGDISNSEPHKCSELKFFPLDDLPQVMTDVSRRCVLNTVNAIRFDEMGWDEPVDGPN